MILTLICALTADEEEVLTLIDDDSLHSLLELVGGSQAFDGSAQHSLLLRQSTLQPDDLVFQQLVLPENTLHHSLLQKGTSVWTLKENRIAVFPRLPDG